MVIFVHKGRPTGDHFINQNSEGPPINCEAVSAHFQNLWRKVLSCAAETFSALIRLQEFGEAKVCQLYVPVHFHQHVFWFQVSMHDFIRVQISKTHQNLGSDKFNSWFIKPPFVAQMVKQISARNIVHEEVNSQIVLENIGHIDNERILSLRQNIFFSPRINNLTFLDQNIFVYSLHRINLVIFRIDNKENFAKRPFVNYFFYFEVFKGYIASCSDDLLRTSFVFNFFFFFKLFWGNLKFS